MLALTSRSVPALEPLYLNAAPSFVRLEPGLDWPAMAGPMALHSSPQAGLASASSQLDAEHALALKGAALDAMQGGPAILED